MQSEVDVIHPAVPTEAAAAASADALLASGSTRRRRWLSVAGAWRI